ncbi:EscU/YscU/HrcU family type III secretion system export apparatus switch protein [Endothiovibrio diazotrophicus]
MKDKQTPPEIAVALEYDGRGAPKVTAKGTGELAEQILQLARENEIPLHEDPILSEVLAQIDLGNQIPPALYLAVAEVIAFAYLVSGRMPPRPDRPHEAGVTLDLRPAPAPPGDDFV